MRWLASLLLIAGCAEPSTDDRTAFLRSTMARADRVLIRTRPTHAAGKYARMASNLYDYYRGTVPIFAADFQNGELDASRSAFASSSLVLSTGDAHPENFGLLLADDDTLLLGRRSLAIEPNDFDSADRYPYLWDVRRMCVGLALAARLSNPEDPIAREAALEARPMIVRAAARGYAEAMQRHAEGWPGARVTEAGTSPHFADLFRRGVRDLEARRELDILTEIDPDGRRVLVRGAPAEEGEPPDYENLFQDLPPEAFAALEDTLARYQQTLWVPRAPEYFQILDAARVLGSGVASWPRIRVAILVRGPSDSIDDDVVLELKELIDSSAQPWRPPLRYYDTVQERVLGTSRFLWARPDAEGLWGVSEWLGLPVQIRREAEAQKSLRVSRMVEERGTPEGLVETARQLGQLLARLHSTTPESTREVASVIATDLEAFVAEQVAESLRYADRVEADWMLWQRIVADTPLLGVPRSVDDEPRPEALEVLGVPAQPLEAP